MEIGMYEKEVEDKEIREIAERILPDTSFGKIYRICEQYGEEEADCREYDVYKLVTPEGDRMLKKADKREVSNYEKYLKQKRFLCSRILWALGRRRGISGSCSRALRAMI